MKTIKQIADELGVSKTAIRNYMDSDFREKHTQTNHNGVITIDSEGRKLIAMCLGRMDKLSENTEKKFSETEETSENIVVPRVVWDALQAQLTAKDEQINAKDLQIANLTETVKSQAQSINADRHNELAGTMQRILPDKKKRLWGFWRKENGSNE